MNLRWLSSVPVSCLYAAEAWLRNPPHFDAVLAEVLAGPAQKLQKALEEQSVPAERFWSHVVPLAVNIDNVHQLAEVALTKTIGRQRAETHAILFRELMSDLCNAFISAIPRLPSDPATNNEALRQQWGYYSKGLLGRMVSWIEEELLVEEAVVVSAYPARGEGGVAHLQYNVACIETVPVDQIPDLPEVLRLCWLLTLLNMDVPRYSEQLPSDRLHLVTSLAMIPPTLAAGEESQLTRCDETKIGLALQHWLAHSENAVGQAPALSHWWKAYCDMRPNWITALKTLDRMLKEA